MRAVVTGASGFVGRGLLAGLAAKGHEGWATGRTPPPNLPAGWRAARREDLLGDAGAAAGADAVVHLEVKHHVPRPTSADIREFHEVNVAGTMQWLDWAARNGVRRFVFVSSIKAAASDLADELIGDDSAGKGRGVTRPDSPYGESKALAEAAVRAWAAADAGRIGAILRPAPVYGPGNGANLAAFVRQVVRGRPCLIGSGDIAKSVVSRTNLVAAIEFLMARSAPGCDVFNVSDSRTVSLRDLAALIASLWGAPRPRRLPAWAAGAVARFGDGFTYLTGRDFPLTTARMRQLLAGGEFPCTKLMAAGFRHPQTTEEGLAEMLEWLREQRA